MATKSEPGRAPRVYDITIRMRRRDRKPFTEAQARAALWKAHKLAGAGEPRSALKEWQVLAINWRRTNSRTGAEKAYAYDTATAAWDALANMGGILNTVGKDGLRIGQPEGGEE